MLDDLVCVGLCDVWWGCVSVCVFVVGCVVLFGNWCGMCVGVCGCGVVVVCVGVMCDGWCVG